jgi:hypothetical protein
MPDRFPFFIVGAQRSGTTLLRLILNAHSQVAVPEEARFLSPLLTRRYLESGLDAKRIQKLVGYLEASAEYELWNYDRAPFLASIRSREHLELAELIHLLYSSYAKSEAKPLWGDKSLFFRNLDVLSRLFPNATFIHIVRDGRDVFDSWRKMDRTKNCAPAVALDWRLKLAMIERGFARMPTERTLTIRFEDLLEDAEKVTRGVCAFLGLEYEPRMLDFHKDSDRYIGAHHSQLIFRPIDNKNQSKWRSNLTRREKQAFDLIASAWLERFGYGCSGESASMPDRAAVWNELIRGAAKRGHDVFRDAKERRRALQEGKATKAIIVGERPSEHREGPDVQSRTDNVAR